MRYITKLAWLCSVAILMVATAAFGQSRASTDPEGVRRFSSMLKSYQFRPPNSQTDLIEVQDLLRLGRSVIGPLENVTLFNKDNDVSMVGKLVDISTVDIPEIRINAALILTDVTENRTVCAVLNRLLESDLNDNSRFNLLQITRGVSTRLKNVEVKYWIKSTIEQNRRLVEKLPNMEKTQNLLSDIQRIIDSKVTTDKLSNDYPQSYAECSELKHIKELKLPGNN